MTAPIKLPPDPSESMRQRVAFVIGDTLKSYSDEEFHPEHLNFVAGVVFQALREATPEMLEAFYRTPRGRAARPLDHWQAMIDEARRARK